MIPQKKMENLSRTHSLAVSQDMEYFVEILMSTHWIVLSSNLGIITNASSQLDLVSNYFNM